MGHLLFKEIAKFHLWSETYSNVTEDERGGDWECSYKNWSLIGKLFEDFLQSSAPSTWDNETIKELLYIVARDNECERLSNIVGQHQQALKLLTTSVIHHGPGDAKWQLAVQLKKLNDLSFAEQLLEKLVQDNDEYVSRRALLTLAEIGSKKTEHYCAIAWNKDLGDLEHQRIAVLHSLYNINSSLLSRYLRLAKEDGSKYLLFNVDLIEKKLSEGRTNGS